MRTIKTLSIITISICSTFIAIFGYAFSQFSKEEQDTATFGITLGIIALMSFIDIYAIAVLNSLKEKKHKAARDTPTGQMELDFGIESNATRAKGTPSIRGAILALLVLLAIQTIASAVLVILAGKVPFFGDASLQLGISNLLAFFSLCAFYAWRNGKSLATLALARPFDRRWLAPVVLATVGLGVLLIKMSTGIDAVLPVPDFLKDFLSEISEKPANAFTSILTLAVVAPITEELLFRGVFLRAFLKRHSATKAIVVTSLMFALIHLNPWQAIPAFILGLAFAAMDIRTGSILPSVISHAIYNFLVLAINSSWIPQALVSSNAVSEIVVGLCLVAAFALFQSVDRATRDPAAG